MGEFISFTAGAALFWVSMLVLIAYRPSGISKRADKSARVLGWAIFLGFLSDNNNTLWWQLLGWFNAIIYPIFVDFRGVGLYLDGYFKGIATVSGVLHLYALKLALSPGEQEKWRWYQMPFYPSRHWTLMLFGPRKDKE